MYKIIGADQKEYGPITADQLRQWITEGRVNGESRVLPEGATDWKRMVELPEFASVWAAAPPLPTPAPPPGPTLAPGSPRSMVMPPVPPKSNQLAVWAMVTGILAVICCQFIGPVSIVLGAVALSQIKQHPEQTGHGFAVTGIVLGVLSLLLVIVGLILVFSFPQYFQNFANPLNQ
jgi:hypothetical protein